MQDNDELGGQDQSWLSDLTSGTAAISPELVDTCRDYLLLVAHSNLDTDIQGKFGASDLVQETFLHAQERFDQFRGQSEGELVSWLRKILLNHLIDEKRKYRQTGKRQVARERRLDRQGDSLTARREIASDGQSPSSEAIAQEETRALLKAMDRLPDDYRQVVVLRNWDRLSFSEIGERMNRSPEAARKLWTRAIERLQGELDQSNEPGSGPGT